MSKRFVKVAGIFLALLMFCGFALKIWDKPMNVREVPTNVGAQVDGQEIGTITKATVFIPNGKEQIFIKKLTQYATELTPGGNPKHKALA